MIDSLLYINSINQLICILLSYFIEFYINYISYLNVSHTPYIKISQFYLVRFDDHSLTQSMIVYFLTILQRYFMTHLSAVSAGLYCCTLSYTAASAMSPRGQQRHNSGCGGRWIKPTAAVSARPIWLHRQLVGINDSYSTPLELNQIESRCFTVTRSSSCPITELCIHNKTTVTPTL